MLIFKLKKNFIALIFPGSNVCQGLILFSLIDAGRTDGQMDWPIPFIFNRLPEYGLSHLCAKLEEDWWKIVNSRVGQG